MAKLDEQGLSTFVQELDKHINTKINRLGGADRVNIADRVIIKDEQDLFEATNVEEALAEVKSELDSLELIASNVKMSNGTSVEDTVSTNKSNISSLQTKVNNGQNHKVTQDNGRALLITGTDLNDISVTGTFQGHTLANSPDGTGDWFYVESLVRDANFRYQRLTKLNDYTVPKYERLMRNGAWEEWRTIQSHKLTNNDGTSFSLANADLNTITKTGNYVGKNWTNAPNKNYAIVEVTQGTSGIVKQVFTETTSTNQYMRIYRSSAWSSWREL